MKCLNADLTVLEHLSDFIYSFTNFRLGPNFRYQEGCANVRTYYSPTHAHRLDVSIDNGRVMLSLHELRRTSWKDWPSGPPDSDFGYIKLCSFGGLDLSCPNSLDIIEDKIVDFYVITDSDHG